MSEKPSLLIVSCSNTKPKSLIKLLTKFQDVNEDPLDHNIISHNWLIDTKYYTAEIKINGINENYKRTEQFNNDIEALIIHMDSNKETGLDNLKIWDCLETDCDPEVKLLLANYCNADTKITRTQATEWCLKRGFELVELYPSDDIDEDNKSGIERVVEALHAHTWSNLMMKDKHFDSQTQIVSKNAPLSVDLAEMGEQGGISDDFSDLFSKLALMKDSLQTMPVSQRKQCAEEMVTAFWKAIGGDDEEINDT